MAREPPLNRNEMVRILETRGIRTHPDVPYQDLARVVQQQVVDLPPNPIDSVRRKVNKIIEREGDLLGIIDCPGDCFQHPDGRVIHCAMMLEEVEPMANTKIKKKYLKMDYSDPDSYNADGNGEEVSRLALSTMAMKLGMDRKVYGKPRDILIRFIIDEYKERWPSGGVFWDNRCSDWGSVDEVSEDDVAEEPGDEEEEKEEKPKPRIKRGRLGKKTSGKKTSGKSTGAKGKGKGKIQRLSTKGKTKPKSEETDEQLEFEDMRENAESKAAPTANKSDIDEILHHLEGITEMSTLLDRSVEAAVKLDKRVAKIEKVLGSFAKFFDTMDWGLFTLLSYYLMDTRDGLSEEDFEDITNLEELYAAMGPEESEGE